MGRASQTGRPKRNPGAFTVCILTGRRHARFLADVGQQVGQAGEIAVLPCPSLGDSPPPLGPVQVARRLQPDRDYKRDCDPVGTWCAVARLRHVLHFFASIFTVLASKSLPPDRKRRSPRSLGDGGWEARPREMMTMGRAASGCARQASLSQAKGLHSAPWPATLCRSDTDGGLHPGGHQPTAPA